MEDLIKLKQIEPLDKAVTDIVGDGTVPLAFRLEVLLLATHWIQNGAIYEYDYTNNSINEHSIAQVIPHNDYLNIARIATLLPANLSYNGGLFIYSLNSPSGDIMVTINVFGDGVEPQPPVEVPIKLSQLTKDIDFDERYYTEEEMNTKLSAKSDTLHNHTLASLSEKSYDSLTDKPTIPTLPISISDVINLQPTLDGKQSTLVSGVSLKTLNSVPLLGPGNIEILGGGETTNVQILSANKTLAANDAPVQMYTCTASRIINLPTADIPVGQKFEIWNRNTINSDANLQIQALSADVYYLSPLTMVILRWDGVKWFPEVSQNINIGSGSYGNKEYGIGIGHGAYQNSTYGVGIGAYAYSNYSNGIGIGTSARFNYSSGVGIGNDSNNNSNSGVGIGRTSTSNSKGIGTVALGAFSKSERNREIISTAASNATNDAQVIIQKFSKKDLLSNSANFQELFIDGSSARLTIIASSVYHFRIQINAMDRTNFDVKTWDVIGAIKRNASNVTSLVSAVTKTVVSENTETTAWDVQVTADDTNESLKIEVKHNSVNQVRFSLNIFATETRL